MLRFLIRLLIVLTVLNAAFNSLWAAAAHTPITPMYAALALAFVLALLLGHLERTALAWRNERMTQITLHIQNAQPFADSRDLATALGHQHKNVLGLLGDYDTEFAALGTVAFETRPLSGGGLPQRWAYLSEDQCYFLLTLVRNTDLVVQLKLGLVQAFRAAREDDPVVPALPTDPLELLALSLQGLQQHRAQIQALEQANIKLERRLDDTPIRMHPTLEARVKAGCQALSRVHPRSFQGAYHSFKEAFGVQGAPLARYDSLPAFRFQEAMDWLDLQTRTFSAQHPLLEGRPA